MGIPLKLIPPRDRYMHGWGQQCHNAKPVTCTWELTFMDRDNHPITLHFDLVNDSSPLVIGLDVGRYSDTINRTEDPHICIQRPSDPTPHRFTTYIAPDSSENPDCIRIRVQLLRKTPKHITSLLSSLADIAQNDLKTFVRRIHRYTHVHPDQLRDICKSAGILNNAIETAIDATDAACTICVGNGRPLPSKKVSLNHVNEAFNQEVQIDFTFINIYQHQSTNTSVNHGRKYMIIVITDTRTGYKECAVVDARDLDTIIRMYETIWLCRHGASRYISADDEYHRTRLVRYFSAHGIEFKARPTRSHNKLGIVERKNGTLKTILRKLAMEHSNAPMDTLVARATFLSNLFSGSQVLSSFELVRGYQPSILGIPTTYVTQELIHAQAQQAATRALQRVLHSRTPNVPTAGMFKPGDVVWVWYASTKNNEPDEWIQASIVQIHTQYLEVRRIKNGLPCRGPTMKPAYEDIRVAPQHELARELMSCSIETELGYGISWERGVDIQPSDSNTENNSAQPHGDERAPQNTVPALMTTIEHPKGPEQDIGEYANSTDAKTITAVLKSERSRVLDEIHKQIGSQQVTRQKLNFAPPWIIDQAFTNEYNSNWRDAFEPVPEHDVPKNANVITSHVVYKVKTDEEGDRTLKARFVQHGNRDDEKDSIRKDSATAQLDIIRLLLSLAIFLGFRLATADIKGAYLQSGPIKRDIYVRPPREWLRNHKNKRGTLWKLTKLPYGIVEAGRQWQKTFEEWMLGEGGLERVFGLSQLFIHRDKHGSIAMIVAKVTDDFEIGLQTRVRP